MRIVCILLMVSVLAVVVGCAVGTGSVSSFYPVNLKQDLDESTLSRYETELKGVPAGHHTDHLLTLERTNWWPLGIVAFWRRGTVQAMRSANSPHTYLVSRTRGLGPLSVLYVSKEQAVYREDGKRLNYMANHSLGWGHLAMFHMVGWSVSDKEWMEHRSAHLIHHLLNIATGHGGYSVSILSAPNPLGTGE